MSTYGSRLAEKAHEPGKAMRKERLHLEVLEVVFLVRKSLQGINASFHNKAGKR